MINLPRVAFAPSSVQAQRIAVVNDAVAQLERDGNICGLVRMLKNSSADSATKTNAAAALYDLASSNDANRAAVMRAGALPLLVELLSNGLDKEREDAAATLCSLAAGIAANKAAVAAAGVIPLLVELLGSGSEGLRSKATGTLVNIAGTDHTAGMRAGVIPQQVELLRGGCDEVKALAAGTLGILTGGDRVDIAEAIVATGALSPLRAMTRGGSDHCKDKAAAALRNLIPRTPEPIMFAIFSGGGIPEFAGFL
jgi:hypothetical protein